MRRAFLCTVLLATCARASFDDDARAALNASSLGGALSLSVAATTAIADTAAQLDLDACTTGDPEVGNYMRDQGGITRLVEDASNVDAAVSRCIAGSLPPDDANALRERMLELGHHLKMVRALVRPCVLAAPDDEAPTTGAWALNAWLKEARETLDTRGCIPPEQASLTAMTLQCTRCRGAIIALAASFSSVTTALVGGCLWYFLGAVSPRGPLVPLRRRRSASSDAFKLTPRARHSISGPEAPRPFKHEESGSLVERPFSALPA